MKDVHVKRIHRVIIYIVAIVGVIYGTSISVVAHSGKTDENGGHYDRSTGEYHYHHGYPAHDHPNGVCPYDYDDKTNHNSSNSSGSSSRSYDYDYDTKISKTVKQTNPFLEMDKNGKINDLVYIVGTMYHRKDCPRNSKNTGTKLAEAVVNNYKACEYCNAPVLTNGEINTYKSMMAEQKKPKQLAWGVSIFAVLVFFVGTGKYNKKKKDELKRKEQEENSRKLEERKQKWINEYAGKDLLKLVNAPDGAYIAEDGKPATKGNTKYGEYTVYVATTGKCFHQRNNCGGNKLRLSNYCYNYNLKPCSRCVERIPQIQWYFDYKKIIDEKNRCKISDDEIKISSNKTGTGYFCV